MQKYILDKTIKETFLNLQDHKIEQVQKIINGVTKPKPQINITSKDSLQKQIIVLISIENTKYFIRKSSFHIININRALKGIKLNVMANFIHTNAKGIIISTNNVVYPSDL